MNDINLIKYIQENNIEYGDVYFKTINEKSHNVIKKDNFKIILEYISDNTISEIHIEQDDSLYFLSCISHKIRNPLNNILGLLTFIDDPKLDKNQKKYINLLKKSSYELIGVANDLVDIINLNKDEINIFFEKISIEKLVNECKNIVNQDIVSKNLSFKINISKDVPLIQLLDKNRVRQLIINLLNNAIYHTNMGGISIEIVLFNKNMIELVNCPFLYIDHRPPIYNILFKIKDTGSGIDDASIIFVDKILGINKKKNFQPYKYGGFGLLISRYLCHSMGGNIWFKTDTDIGTVFYFNIICDCLM